MADTPGFPETNPVLFLDSQKRLFFLWPVILAHQWETALMKYRISTDYQQADGPPKWEFQDNILLMPKNIVEKTDALVAPLLDRACDCSKHSFNCTRVPYAGEYVDGFIWVRLGAHSIEEVGS